MNILITNIYDFGGVLAAEGVDEHGETVYAVLGDPEGDHGCACPKHAAHEQLGKLPPRILARIEGGARR